MTIMNIGFYQEDLKRIWKKNNFSYDYFIHHDGSIVVDVMWGDWKHDHLFLNHVMRQNNYRLVSEEVTEEDGDDAYSSLHKFRYGA